MLYDKLANGWVQCHICQWRCKVAPGKVGYCKTRLNRDGVLYTLIYNQTSSIAIDPIEKKPLFHFYPASQALSLGTWGCNFRCEHCQNWHISYAEHNGLSPLLEGRRIQGEELSASRSVALAKRHRCGGISWTYNEPTIWFEYTLEGAKLAKADGLYTVYVTNGYITPEALDTIGPYLDAFRADFKGFTDDFYRQVCHLRRWRGILEVTLRAKDKWNMHIEVITNVIPGYNDDAEQLRALAVWVKDNLGANTPWHVTRFYPHARMTHVPPTPLATLQRARRIGLEAGLHFVYLGNVPGAEGESTHCYSCQNLVIQRSGYHTQVLAVEKGGKCRYCGADLNVRGV